VRNKIEDLLSRVAALEEDFATLPGEVDEQRRRRELIWYVTLRSFLRPGVDFLPVSSRTSRGNCGPSMRGKSCSDLMTTFETMKMYSGFSKTCERPSPITGFVQHHCTILDVDRESRWSNEWWDMGENAKQ